MSGCQCGGCTCPSPEQVRKETAEAARVVLDPSIAVHLFSSEQKKPTPDGGLHPDLQAALAEGVGFEPQPPPQAQEHKWASLIFEGGRINTTKKYLLTYLKLGAEFAYGDIELYNYNLRIKIVVGSKTASKILLTQQGWTYGRSDFPVVTISWLVRSGLIR